jgi:uncharacterized protein
MTAIGRRRGGPGRGLPYAAPSETVWSEMNRSILGALMAVALAVPGMGGAAEDLMRVVYHVNQADPERHQIALTNIQNHINGTGAANMDIKVVLHGAGLDLLLGAAQNPDLRAGIDSLKLQGVRFQVCERSMKTRQLAVEQLYDVAEADIVPSGVMQISELQGQGYSYIKP